MCFWGVESKTALQNLLCCDLLSINSLGLLTEVYNWNPSLKNCSEDNLLSSLVCCAKNYFKDINKEILKFTITPFSGCLILFYSFMLWLKKYLLIKDFMSLSMLTYIMIYQYQDMHQVYIFCHSIYFLEFRRTLPRYISLISIILT